MSKTVKKFFAGLLAFVMVFAMTAAAAPAKEVKADEKSVKAYLAYADSAWAVQYWGEDPTTLTNGVVPTNTEVTGPGQYTVGLDFTGAAGGVAPEVAFAGVMLDQAELVFPGSILVIDEVKVNGTANADAKKYYVESVVVKTYITDTNCYFEETLPINEVFNMPNM